MPISDDRLLDQNPPALPASECGHRDDPGHDHEQCLENASSNRARAFSQLDPWQRPEDGFPTDAYFEAVAAALRATGVHLDDWHREEDWEVVYELADDVIAASPYAWAEHGLYVSWRVDEQSEPLGDGFDAIVGLDLPGWFWVPYSKPGAGGDYAKNFEIHPLAEPEDVAAAVWLLLHPDAARTVPTASRPSLSEGGAA